MFIVAKQVEQTIMSFGEVSRFQLTVGRQQYRDEITLKLELNVTDVDEAKLAEDLNRKFQDTCRIKIDKIEIAEKGSISEDKQGIVDERTWE
jgi:phenylacetate-coenzyme A ligase PaaK-like adenylate-forming protein